MGTYLVGMNFQEYIEADSEAEAIERFSDRYDINQKYLSADKIEEINGKDEDE